MIAMKIATSIKINSECVKAQTKCKFCCNGKKPEGEPCAKPPVAAPTVAHAGPCPKCNLCRNNAFPSDPHHVIHMLHVGAGTCEQRHFEGQKGTVPTHLCDPLRFFAYEPCGCKPKDNAKELPTCHVHDTGFEIGDRSLQDHPCSSAMCIDALIVFIILLMLFIHLTVL